MLHQGLRWRIGSGDKVKIYKSNWIPKPSTFKILSTPTIPLDATTSLLIGEEHKWNEVLIKQQFTPEDAEHMLKIRLPRSPRLDRLIWVFDKHGNYSMKNGYQIALKLKFPDWPSTLKRNSSEWHAIWELDLPKKVKIFMWRAAQNLLPTVKNLWERKV